MVGIGVSVSEKKPSRGSQNQAHDPRDKEKIAERCRQPVSIFANKVNGGIAETDRPKLYADTEPYDQQENETLALGTEKSGREHAENELKKVRCNLAGEGYETVSCQSQASPAVRWVQCVKLWWNTRAAIRKKSLDRGPHASL